MGTVKYIALLRGVNIGGHQVKMEQLRELFRELGFSSVRSYIQTGNVFFETTDSNRAALTRKIEGSVAKIFCLHQILRECYAPYLLIVAKIFFATHYERAPLG